MLRERQGRSSNVEIKGMTFTSLSLVLLPVSRCQDPLVYKPLCLYFSPFLLLFLFLASESDHFPLLIFESY